MCSTGAARSETTADHRAGRPVVEEDPDQHVERQRPWRSSHPPRDAGARRGCRSAGNGARAPNGSAPAAGRPDARPARRPPPGPRPAAPPRARARPGAGPAPCSSTLSERPDPVAQQRGAGVAGLLRVELGGASAGRSRPRPRTGRHRARPRSPAAPGSGRWSRGSTRARRTSARSRSARPRCRRTAWCRRAPSTVFQPMCGTIGACSRSTTPGHSSQPSVSTPCSTPRSNSTCMPTQIPSTGRPPASRRPITRSPRTRRSPAMHAANAPTPGTTSPSASCASWMSAVSVTSRAGALDRAHGGAEIPRPVVEDDDVLHRSRACPWWRERRSRAGRTRRRRAAPGRTP